MTTYLDYEDKPVTPWFKMDVAPERIGVYRLRSKMSPGDKWQYSHWNGKFWGTVSMSPDFAKRYENNPSKAVEKNDYSGWCGLAEEPVQEAPIKVSKPILIPQT